MANDHIEVENKRKDTPPERRYIVFSTSKDGTPTQSDFFRSRQQAADYVYELIQQGSSSISVFQEVPYRIQI